MCWICQVEKPKVRAQRIKTKNFTKMKGSTRGPLAVSFEGNVIENWKKWWQRFNTYLKAADEEFQPEERRIAVLSHVTGEESMEKFDTFAFTDD